MKKLLALANTQHFSFRLIRALLVLIVGLALGIGFWTATADPPGGKCDVCHNDHNYHDISIPCDQVDKFLANHPGDCRGPCPCNVTNVQNP